MQYGSYSELTKQGKEKLEKLEQSLDQDRIQTILESAEQVAIEREESLRRGKHHRLINSDIEIVRFESVIFLLSGSRTDKVLMWRADRELPELEYYGLYARLASERGHVPGDSGNNSDQNTFRFFMNWLKGIPPK